MKNTVILIVSTLMVTASASAFPTSYFVGPVSGDQDSLCQYDTASVQYTPDLKGKPTLSIVESGVCTGRRSGEPCENDMTATLAVTPVSGTFSMNFLNYKSRDSKAVFSENTLSLDAIVRTFIAETDHFTASLVFDEQAQVIHYTRTLVPVNDSNDFITLKGDLKIQN